MEQPSLLSNIEFNSVFASAGKRFLNFLIDFVIFRLLNVFALIGIILSINNLSPGYTSPFYGLTLVLIALLLHIIFYFLTELVLKGRTIGKFITGTKAVNEDGTTLSAKTA